MKTFTLKLPNFWATALFHDATQFGVSACDVHEYTFFNKKDVDTI